MKLSLVINTFNSTEFLQHQINQIKPLVDNVTLIWQKKSYFGDPILKADHDEIFRLKEVGLVDDIIEYNPDFTKQPRQQETDKRNQGINYARSKGFTHCIVTDSDELYDFNQFKAAKELIIEKKYTITYCPYVNYWKDFDHYLVFPTWTYVPFISSTKFNYVFNSQGVPVTSDPTRRFFNPYKFGEFVFKHNELLMAHAAWVRKDLEPKLKGWSAKHFIQNANYEELSKRVIKAFNEWKEGDDALLVLNVPGNKVKVKKARFHHFMFEV